MANAFWVAYEPERLRLGDTGTEVRELQEVLTAYGFYHGSINSIFGFQTEKAVFELQRCLGLNEDGTFNQATWYALSFWSGGLKQNKPKASEHVSSLDAIKNKVLTVLKFRGREYSVPQAIASTKTKKGLKFRGVAY